MNQVSGAVRFVVNLRPGWRFLSGGCPAAVFQSNERRRMMGILTVEEALAAVDRAKGDAGRQVA
jgi:hypothetical protein